MTITLHGTDSETIWFALESSPPIVLLQSIGTFAFSVNARNCNFIWSLGGHESNVDVPNLSNAGDEVYLRTFIVSLQLSGVASVSAARWAHVHNAIILEYPFSHVVSSANECIVSQLACILGCEAFVINDPINR